MNRVEGKKKERKKQDKISQTALKQLQALPLEVKIRKTQIRQEEYTEYFNGEVYVSFSGGKDSAILAELYAEVCAKRHWEMQLVYCNTGLEYPEIKGFVEYFAEYLRWKYKIKVNLIIVRPKKYNREKKKYEIMTFDKVLLQYGYPVISKQVAMHINRFRINPKEEWRINKYLHGIEKDGSTTQFYIPQKYQYIALEAPFKISEKCCPTMKHNPFLRYEKETGQHPMIGMLADDDHERQKQYKKTGCNAFDLKRPMSNPMGFWTTQNVLRATLIREVPLCDVYGRIIETQGQLCTTGCDRTGCMFCMMGLGEESYPNRFQQMQISHPKQYAYCIRKTKVYDQTGKEIIFTPDVNVNGWVKLMKEMLQEEFSRCYKVEYGLNLGEILDFLNIPYDIEDKRNLREERKDV